MIRIPLILLMLRKGRRRRIVRRPIMLLSGRLVNERTLEILRESGKGGGYIPYSYDDEVKLVPAVSEVCTLFQHKTHANDLQYKLNEKHNRNRLGYVPLSVLR